MITLLYILPCVFLAMLNAKWIKDGKKIKHFWNGLIHVTVSVIFGWQYHWWHFFTILLIARVSFDWPLNLFRGLPLGYVSPKPKSIMDRAEKAIFGLNGILPKIIYIAAIITILICGG